MQSKLASHLRSSCLGCSRPEFAGLMTPEIFLTRRRSEGVSPDRRLWFSVALCGHLHLLHGGPLLETACLQRTVPAVIFFLSTSGAMPPTGLSLLQPYHACPRQAFLYHRPAENQSFQLLQLRILFEWQPSGASLGFPLSGIPRPLPASLQPFLITYLWLVSFPGSMMAL